MQHDEQIIEKLLITGVGAKSSMRKALREYHEHMIRWRSLDEFPEQGQRIEVACHYPKMGLYSEVDNFDSNRRTMSEAEMWGLTDDELTPIAWRPAGELPEHDIDE